MRKRLMTVMATGIVLASAATATASATVTARYYGGYWDQATCEYWRGGVDPGGQNTDPCMYNPEAERWGFWDNR